MAKDMPRCVDSACLCLIETYCLSQATEELILSWFPKGHAFAKGQFNFVICLDRGPILTAGNGPARPVNARIYIYMYMYIYVCIYIYMYVYIHIYTYFFIDFGVQHLLPGTVEVLHPFGGVPEWKGSTHLYSASCCFAHPRREYRAGKGSGNHRQLRDHRNLHARRSALLAIPFLKSSSWQHVATRTSIHRSTGSWSIPRRHSSRASSSRLLRCGSGTWALKNEGDTKRDTGATKVNGGCRRLHRRFRC